MNSQCQLFTRTTRDALISLRARLFRRHHYFHDNVLLIYIDSRTSSRCVIYKLLSSFSIFNFFRRRRRLRSSIVFFFFFPAHRAAKSALNVNKQRDLRRQQLMQLFPLADYFFSTSAWVDFISTAHDRAESLQLFSSAASLSSVVRRLQLFSMKSPEWRTFQKLMGMWRPKKQSWTMLIPKTSTPLKD